jgi:hypothetical protein
METPGRHQRCDKSVQVVKKHDGPGEIAEVKTVAKYGDS